MTAKQDGVPSGRMIMFWNQPHNMGKTQTLNCALKSDFYGTCELSILSIKTINTT